MSDTATEQSVAGLSGKIRLTPRIAPVLTHGDYKVEITMKSPVTSNIAKLTQNLAVGMQPFTLDPERVYSVYPVENSVGIYSDVLPHIVLNSKSYPWDRSLTRDSNVRPWVALLVFSADEARSYDIDAKSIKQEGVLTPTLDEKTEALINKNSKYEVVDIPSGLFADVLPCWDELPYLAHTREVSLDNKVTDPQVQDGWFSVVTANRFPLGPRDAAAAAVGSVCNNAYLVSLEGFEEYLKKEPKDRDLSRYHTVRMFCLNKWSFYCEYKSFDFLYVTEHIDVGVLAHDPSIIEDETARAILAAGYCPVNHYFREGSGSVSWYRSPLVPYKPKDYSIELCQYPDRLLRFDPDLQMFDVSYAAAWQLGRLLALQDQAYAQALYKWRLENKRESAKEKNNDAVIAQTLRGRTRISRRQAKNKQTEAEDCCKSLWAATAESAKAACGISDRHEMRHVVRQRRTTDSGEGDGGQRRKRPKRGELLKSFEYTGGQ